MIQRSVSEDPVKMNESFLFFLPVLSLCRSRGKLPKDSYPADERIVHLPTVSLDQCFVLLPTESSDQCFVLLPTKSFGSMIRLSAGYGSLDHFSRDLHRRSTGS